MFIYYANIFIFQYDYHSKSASNVHFLKISIILYYIFFILYYKIYIRKKFLEPTVLNARI